MGWFGRDGKRTGGLDATTVKTETGAAAAAAAAGRRARRGGSGRRGWVGVEAMYTACSLGRARDDGATYGMRRREKGRG